MHESKMYTKIFSVKWAKTFTISKFIALCVITSLNKALETIKPTCLTKITSLHLIY